MNEENKAIVIVAVVVSMFLTIIFGLRSWERYEIAKLDYMCVPE